MGLDEASGPTTEGESRHRRREAIAEGIAKGRSRFEEARSRLDEARGHSQTIDAAYLAAEHDVRIGGGVLAGAVAFRLFLFLVPLAFFLVFGLGFGASSLSETPTDLAHHLGIGGLIAKAATSGAAQGQAGRVAIFVIAGFATALGAHAALKVVRIVHALVWSVRAPKAAHPWRATGIFVLVVVAALLLSAFLATLGHTSLLAAVGAEVLSFALAFGLWLLLAWFMPRTDDTPWTALVPGALLVALGVVVLHLATIYVFARYISRKSATYGTIGGSLALLFWVYLVGRLIIASAVLNAALAARRVRREPEAEAPISPDQTDRDS
jgi:uncharacterized BrkB/YihY/UPF0761 family membrane protein